MQSNSVGNVKIKTSTFKRSKFPLNKNIYTSCGFGEVQPIQCLALRPDSKTVLRPESLVYLASLASATYGHINVNLWHYFVNYSDLTDLYGQIMSETAVSRMDGVLAYPEKFPHMQRNYISTLPLWGAHCTCYVVDNLVNGTYQAAYPFYRQNDPDNSSYEHVQQVITELRNNASVYLLNQVDPMTDVHPFEIHDNPFGTSSVHVDLRCLIDMPNERVNHPIWLPLSNPNYDSLFEFQYENGKTATAYKGVDIAPVDLDSADFIIERTFPVQGQAQQTKTYIFAFRMHAFGKRIFKVLKGCNFQEDFTSTKPCSLLPLFAVYKAYFDSFGLLQYDNWFSTSVARMMKYFDSTGGVNAYFGQGAYSDHYDDGGTTGIPSFMWQKFVMDIGSLWVTDSVDYVSAHMRNNTASPSVDQSFMSTFIGTGNSAVDSDTTHVAVPQSTGTDESSTISGHAYINEIIHGQLSSELLKTLYLWTNRNTAVGKAIEKMLRAQGLGKWVDHQKPRFIGFETFPIDFSQVISTSDTESDGKGAVIGQRGGRGQGYNDGKKVFYHNDEEGLLVSLLAVVPDAGYTQQSNVAFDMIDKYSMYLPDFDGKGWEFEPIKRVVGELPINLSFNGVKKIDETEATFGQIPRSARFKINYNTLSGKFAQRSTRGDYLVYNTDKFIDLGEIVKPVDVYVTDQGWKKREVEFSQIFPVSELPRAGLAWRYPTRYPWLGHFNRIFAYTGENLSNWHDVVQTIENLRKGFEYLNNEEDGFLYMGTLRCYSMERMLQIGDSYETREEGNKGNADMNSGKA